MQQDCTDSTDRMLAKPVHWGPRSQNIPLGVCFQRAVGLRLGTFTFLAQSTTKGCAPALTLAAEAGDFMGFDIVNMHFQPPYNPISNGPSEIHHLRNQLLIIP